MNYHHLSCLLLSSRIMAKITQNFHERPCKSEEKRWPTHYQFCPKKKISATFLRRDFSISMREASLTSFVRPSEAPRSMAQQNWESHDMGCKFLCALTTVFVFRSLFYACIHECMHKYFVAITCNCIASSSYFTFQYIMFNYFHDTQTKLKIQGKKLAIKWLFEKFKSRFSLNELNTKYWFMHL